MRHLSLVPDRPPRAERAAERPVAYVPVKLLLAASGRCSCDDCCRAALAARRRPYDRPVAPTASPYATCTCSASPGRSATAETTEPQAMNAACGSSM